MTTKKIIPFITKLLHIPSNVILFLIAIFLSGTVFYLFFYNMYLLSIGNLNLDLFIEHIFKIFIYIELIAAIRLFFKNNFRFPLRFFIYVGITDLIRHIIIFKNEDGSILLYSGAILILAIALSILEFKNILLEKYTHEKKNSSDPSF